MKSNDFYRELGSDTIFSFKEKKEMVLEDLENAKRFYQKGYDLYKRLVEVAYPESELFPKYKAKLRTYKSHLWWLKQLSKRRALKYALRYHWSFYL